MLKKLKRMLLVHRFDGFFHFLNWFFKEFLQEFESTIWAVSKKGRGPDPLDPSPRCTPEVAGSNQGITVLIIRLYNPVVKVFHNSVKGAPYGLRQFLITESPLKMMKYAFYFTLKALFVLKVFKFLSWLFDR